MKKTNAMKAGLLAITATITLTGCGSTQTNQTAQPTGTASSYPDKPIIVVAPSGAGGGWDKTARSLAKVLPEAKLINQTMTVENKPGGGGSVFLADYVTKDASNDYKLFVSSPPILINNLKKEGNSPFGYQSVTPLAQLTKDYGAFVVRADSKYNDIKEVMADLKADPSKVTIAGGSSPGSMDHVVAILPAYKSGVDAKKLKYVSYDGGGEAMAALLGKNADMIATDASGVGEYLKAGKVKVLAVTSTQRLTGDLKDIPTLKEKGIDADFTIWRGVFGPQKMSTDAKKFWDEKLKVLSQSDAWKKELVANNWENEFRGSDGFKTFLQQQELLIKDVLTALGMAK